MSGEELHSSLHLVRIYFDTATFDNIERDKKIKTEAQLSLIGGTMGLLTGFSIISGVEVIFFLFRSLNKNPIIKTFCNWFISHQYNDSDTWPYPACSSLWRSIISIWNMFFHIPLQAGQLLQAQQSWCCVRHQEKVPQPLEVECAPKQAHITQRPSSGIGCRRFWS